MSHWFHRNPIKATNPVDFNNKRTFPSSSEAYQICSLLNQTRNKLLEFFTDPSVDTDLVKTELDTYVSLLNGFLEDKSENASGDSKLRFAINFKWSQSLGVNFLHEEQDCNFELCNILFNTALWYSKHAAYVAAMTTEPSDKEAKEVHTSLRSAAGLFIHILNDELRKLIKNSSKTEPFYDLTEAIITTYINQSKAEAQEITIARAIELKHTPSLICSISNDTSSLFQAAADGLVNMDPVIVEKWSRYLKLKSRFYKAMTYCYFGADLLSQDKCGDAIKCLQESNKIYVETENLCKEYAKTKGAGTQAIPERHAFFKNLGALINRMSEKCDRENTMIYHQKVALELPLLETKSIHGLAIPIDYLLAEPHALWNKTSYDSFKISKAIDNKSKPEKSKDVKVKEELPIPQGDADPKTNSGCLLS